MRNKKHINKYIEFKLKSEQDPLQGILLDYSEELTLIYTNPVDYVLDGYTVFKNEYVLGSKLHPVNTIESKILRKKIKGKKVPKLNTSSLSDLLENLYKRQVIFSLTNTNKTFLIGKIIEMKKETFVLKTLTTKAKWVGQKEIEKHKVKIIEFETDYINSLIMLL